jgi:hypothetical protein
MSVSVRAKRFWEKLRDWYGTSLTDQYGETPPGDWCDLIDLADNETVKLALSEIKAKHVNWPPRFPELDAIFARVKLPVAAATGPSNVDLLTDFVLRNRTLSKNQLRMPWTFFGRQFDAPGLDEKMRHNHGVEITGVIIPADGDYPGYRVMLQDMQMAAA